MALRMRHWYSEEWYTPNNEQTSTKSATQEELRRIAEMIKEGCDLEEVCENGDFMVCTIYSNKYIGVRYWVHDTCGWISTIDEAREI